jgi:hypothetical protein
MMVVVVVVISETIHNHNPGDTGHLTHSLTPTRLSLLLTSTAVLIFGAMPSYGRLLLQSASRYMAVVVI